MSNQSDSGSASRTTSPDRLVINIKQEPLDTDVSDCESSHSSYYPSSTPPVPTLGSFLGRGGVQRIRHRYGAHIKQSVSPDTCVCEVCQAEFVGPQLLQGHKLCHFNSQHVCYVCDTYFSQCDALVMHMATLHHQLNPQTQGLGNEKEWFVCPICLQKFSSKSSLVNHQRQHVTKEKATSFPCRVCGVDFNDSRGLREHLTTTRHLDMKVKIQSVFVCVDCRSIFANRDAYAMHMMMRAQHEICTVTDTTKTILDNSSTINGNSIDDSQKKISDPDVLKWNVDKTNVLSYRFNGMPKPNNFSCHKCYQSFATQDSLALHMMMHTQSDEPKYTMPSLPTSRSNSVSIDRDVPKRSISSWLCKMCSTYCDSCDSLAMHMMLKHSSSYSSTKNNSSTVVYNNNDTDYKISEDASKPVKPLVRPCSVDTATAASLEQQTTNRNKRSRSVDDQEYARVKQKTYTDELKNKYLLSMRRPNNGESTWQCSGCLRVFPDHLQWTEHVVRVLNTKDKPYCHRCDVSFADKNSLTMHIDSSQHDRKASNSYRPNCSICGWTNDITALVTHHIQTQHKTSNNLDVTQIPAPTNDEYLRSDPHLQEALTFIKAASNVQDNHIGAIEPINLCNNRRENGHSVDSSATNLGHPKLNKRKTFIPSKSNIESPESSEAYYCQNQLTSRLSPPTQVPGPISQSGISTSDINDDDNDVVEFVLANSTDLVMCKHCNIIFMDKTLYHLHMGLHNLNDPWQCNMCGQKCKDLHQFTSHVLHN